MTTFTPGDPDVRVAVREAALRYWSTFGWPVRATESEVLLSLRPDMVAVAVPADLARQLLETLEATGAGGAVLALPGSAAPQWIFLTTRPNHWRVRPNRQLAVLSEGFDLLLPGGLGLNDSVAWVREPLSADAALFDGDLVLGSLAALTSTSSPAQAAA
ncbi:hypothetical protein ACFQ68_11905 [Amycolatopsis japonica]|uniref:hypothetical protein n=1 Tax=Amycolatopsis japonica TaxID=208439 RepID=UPI00366AD454